MRILRIATVIPLLAGLLTVTAATVSRAQSPHFEVGTPPEWVTPLDVKRSPKPGPEVSNPSVRTLLRDEQVRVEAGQEVRFLREVTEINSARGVDEMGRFEISFAPEYERVTIHGVWRTRGTERTSLFDPAGVKVIQAEKELDAQIYNGTLTAMVFLEDLRVGDVIESAYTRQGTNPVFDGHFTDAFLTRSSHPIDRLAYRLLFPTDRKLFFKSHGADHEPSITPGAEYSEYRWEVRDAAAVAWEDAVPGDVVLYPYVQLTDFASWEEVVAWALPLYTPPATLTPELQRQVDALRERGQDDASRFLAAVRFVQDELRYLSVSMGPHSHQPHAPAQVLAQRFGDCKDKSLLLATLLRHLGFESGVAFVNTRIRTGLEEMLPTASTFDHAIVWARIGEREVWIDATSQFHRGDLPHLVPPSFQRALVLLPGVVGFKEMPLEDASEPRTEVEEVWSLLEKNRASLGVRNIYRGSAANRMRWWIASTPREEVVRNLLNFYAGEDPGIRTAAPLELNDDPVRNVFELVEHYEVDRFWKDGSRELYLSSLRERFKRPDYLQRTHPLSLRFPDSVQQRIKILGHDRVPRASESPVINGPGWKLQSALRATDEGLLFEGSWTSSQDRVPPAQLQEHFSAIERGWGATYVQIPYAATQTLFVLDGPGRSVTWLSDLVAGAGARGQWTIFGLGAVLLCVVLAGGWRLARRIRQPRRARAGTTMESALIIRSEGELSTILADQRCDCGGRNAGLNTMSRESAVVLDGLERTPLRWVCPACERSQRTWIVVPEEAESR